MQTTIDHIVKATNGKLASTSATANCVYTIVTDTRSLEESTKSVGNQGSPYIFWALKGDAFDGHDFVEEALRVGAAAIVAEETSAAAQMVRNGENWGVALITVPDTNQALKNLAKSHRLTSNAQVIGVTGSFGKTTTREMIHAALNFDSTSYRSPGNLNNHFGVPFSLLEIESHHTSAIIEMGASHVGEIDSLCEIAQPSIGVITGIGHAHLQGFGSISKVVEAKQELAKSIAADGLVVLPGDSEFCDQLASDLDCRTVVRVGIDAKHNDVVARDVWISNREIHLSVDDSAFKVKVTGRHFLTSILSAIVVGRHVGLSDPQIAAGLEKFTAPPGRCEVKRAGTWTVIDDTYNASPEAMIAACNLLGHWRTNGERVLVCGDMLELGDTVDQHYEKLGIAICENRLDAIFAYGTRAEDTVAACIAAGFDPDSAHAFDDQNELARSLASTLSAAATVLVKGSRARRMERIVELLITSPKFSLT